MTIITIATVLAAMTLVGFATRARLLVKLRNDVLEGKKFHLAVSGDEVGLFLGRRVGSFLSSDVPRLEAALESLLSNAKRNPALLLNLTRKRPVIDSARAVRGFDDIAVESQQTELVLLAEERGFSHLVPAMLGVANDETFTELRDLMLEERDDTVAQRFAQRVLERTGEVRASASVALWSPSSEKSQGKLPEGYSIEVISLDDNYYIVVLRQGGVERGSLMLVNPTFTSYAINRAKRKLAKVTRTLESDILK